MMACHEIHDTPCVGWLVNQLGPGNNINLRMHIRHYENANELIVVGEQHENFEDTIPK